MRLSQPPSEARLGSPRCGEGMKLVQTSQAQGGVRVVVMRAGFTMQLCATVGWFDFFFRGSSAITVDGGMDGWMGGKGFNFPGEVALQGSPMRHALVLQQQQHSGAGCSR